MLHGVVGDMDKTEAVIAVLLYLKKTLNEDGGQRTSSAGASVDRAQRSDRRNAGRCRFLFVLAHCGGGGKRPSADAQAKSQSVLWVAGSSRQPVA